MENNGTPESYKALVNQIKEHILIHGIPSAKEAFKQAQDEAKSQLKKEFDERMKKMKGE